MSDIKRKAPRQQPAVVIGYNLYKIAEEIAEDNLEDRRIVAAATCLYALAACLMEEPGKADGTLAELSGLAARLAREEAVKNDAATRYVM